MSLDVDVPGGDPTKPGFTVARNGSGLSLGAGPLISTPIGFSITNDEDGLSVSGYPTPKPVVSDGFTIYTFKRGAWIHGESLFLGYASRPLTADIMLVGGGGSGGGGYQGGGGGGGGFIDEHDVVIDFSDSDWDGVVTVGAGGALVPYRGTQGNNGGASSFGPYTAYGGGYGSSEFTEHPDGSGANYIYYHASDGASGGGGGPWNPPPAPHVERTDGLPNSGPGGKAVHGDQGYDGRAGSGTTFYGGWHQAGGGGGAGQTGFMWASQPCGGHGRWCDIAGWGPYWEEYGIQIVQWYGGGGAGKERPNMWSFLDGLGGFGGGGETGRMGRNHFGGGGGGNGSLDIGHIGDAEGPPGGSGVVIIRIRSVDEPLVRYTKNAVITRIPADQLHNDERGDEGGPAV